MTPQNQLELLFTGSLKDLRDRIELIDVKAAHITDLEAEKMIHDSIVKRFGALDSMASYLKGMLVSRRAELMEEQLDQLGKMYNTIGTGPAKTADQPSEAGMRWREKQAKSAAGKLWSSECAVSLAFLEKFKTEHLTPSARDNEPYLVSPTYDPKNPKAPDVMVAADKLTTKQVVQAIIKKTTEKRGKCRYAETLEPEDVWSPDRKVGFTFISHAFDNEFNLILQTLKAIYPEKSCDPKNTFVWLDIFAGMIIGILSFLYNRLPAAYCGR